MSEKESDFTGLLFRALRMAALGFLLMLVMSAVWAVGIKLGAIPDGGWDTWLCAGVGLLAGAAAIAGEKKRKEKNRTAALGIACALYYTMTLLVAAAGEGGTVSFVPAAVPAFGMLAGGICANVTNDNKKKTARKRKKHNTRVNNRIQK